MAKLVDAARKDFAGGIEIMLDANPSVRDILDKRAVALAEKDATRKSTLGRPTEHDYHEVAAIYQQALLQGERPTKAVAAHLHISHSAASKVVYRARERGLLPRTERGKARANPVSELISTAKRARPKRRKR